MPIFINGRFLYLIKLRKKQAYRVLKKKRTVIQMRKANMKKKKDERKHLAGHGRFRKEWLVTCGTLCPEWCSVLAWVAVARRS